MLVRVVIDASCVNLPGGRGEMNYVTETGKGPAQVTNVMQLLKDSHIPET